MDMLNSMRAAQEVARTGSFTAAGRALKLSTPSVSRLVSELEADLGVRLFNRTTRRIALTDAGEQFLARGAAILEEVEALRESTQERHSQPGGRLRVSTVNAFGTQMLAPAMPEFLKRYPGIEVELDISNRKVDLVEEHVDVALRVGAGDGAGLDDSGLTARKIFEQKLIFVAAPSYLGEFGEPRTLEDLAGHRLVKQAIGRWGQTYYLRHKGEVIDYVMPEGFVTNAPLAARNALLTGYGCGLAADYLVAPDIAAGRLTRILPDHETIPQSIYALYAHRRHIPARVRVFVDFLAEVFSGGAPGS